MAIAVRKSVGAEIYEMTIVAADIGVGYKFLPAIPSDPSKVLVDVVGGGAQSPNVDYMILGNRIVWNAMGLETLLSDGVRLRLVYY